jgi:glycerol-3-phosphate cytidylyltransferase
MKNIGYLAGDFDLFHVGHLNAIEYAKSHCDFLIVGVVSDEVFHTERGLKPVIPFPDRIEIVRSIRFVDAAVAEITANKLDVWRELRFQYLFEDEHARNLVSAGLTDAEILAAGVELIHLPHLPTTSSVGLRETIENINRLAGQMCFDVSPASLEMRRSLQ